MYFRVKDLERRRTLELEGYGRDVDMVKRKIRLYDEYILRLKKLVEDNPQQIMGIYIYIYIQLISSTNRCGQ